MPSNESVRISNRRLHRAGSGANPLTRVSLDYAWFILSAVAMVLVAPSSSYGERHLAAKRWGERGWNRH
jgi:hypothetical protein